MTKEKKNTKLHISGKGLLRETNKALCVSSKKYNITPFKVYDILDETKDMVNVINDVGKSVRYNKKLFSGILYPLSPKSITCSTILIHIKENEPSFILKISDGDVDWKNGQIKVGQSSKKVIYGSIPSKIKKLNLSCFATPASQKVQSYDNLIRRKNKTSKGAIKISIGTTVRFYASVFKENEEGLPIVKNEKTVDGKVLGFKGKHTLIVLTESGERKLILRDSVVSATTLL